MLILSTGFASSRNKHRHNVHSGLKEEAAEDFQSQSDSYGC